MDCELLGKVKLGERIVPDSVKWSTATSASMASNNWVIAPGRSASGQAMLANDPHLEVNRLPNVWCEQVIELPERYVVGMTVPGLPAVALGRSRDLAWGGDVYLHGRRGQLGRALPRWLLPPRRRYPR